MGLNLSPTGLKLPEDIKPKGHCCSTKESAVHIASPPFLELFSDFSSNGNNSIPDTATLQMLYLFLHLYKCLATRKDTMPGEQCHGTPDKNFVTWVESEGTELLNSVHFLHCSLKAGILTSTNALTDRYKTNPTRLFHSPECQPISFSQFKRCLLQQECSGPPQGPISMLRSRKPNIAIKNVMSSHCNHESY